MNIFFQQHISKVTQLADLLGRDIAAGRYEQGNVLPSINNLSDTYGVSRDTVFKAFAELKERGIIDSAQGKGYYVVGEQKNVLLMLDEYSPFKDVLYNSFSKSLPMNYKIDLWFHQYNEVMFNAFLREAKGRYSKYVVMNFDNRRFSPDLYKIPSSRLLLLDFGNFDKKDYPYICQDFGAGFYNAMEQLEHLLSHYRRYIMFKPRESKHPEETYDYFSRFCRERNWDCRKIESLDGHGIVPGDVYVAVRQVDIVALVKKGRDSGLVCGRDYGLIAYNDTPVYEVIDRGITVMSVDWVKMGHRAADFVVTGKPIHEYVPTEVKIRGSL